MSPEHEVLEILARYVRAVDYRDSAGMASLFSSDGQVCVFYNNAGSSELVFKISGPEAIAKSMTDLMAPHPKRGWSHHTTHDHITRVNGDFATIDAQFIRFDSLGDARPKGQLSVEQRNELSRRDAELDANPGMARTWEQIRARLEATT